MNVSNEKYLEENDLFIVYRLLSSKKSKFRMKKNRSSMKMSKSYLLIFLKGPVHVINGYQLGIPVLSWVCATKRIHSIADEHKSVR